ncbi:hypothetical protein SAMN05216416_0728 [Streptococcus equinus]|nr:hypothetical protein SAMN05216346_101573 [Streptococcus equinus]SFR66762.1 hypothetical protein SAMN05216416_0728 [Streptococcus equinus]
MKVMTKENYYKAEYEHIVDRFIWNGRIYNTNLSEYDCCYKEACEEVEKLFKASSSRGDVTGRLRFWALNALKRQYELNKRVS